MLKQNAFLKSLFILVVMALSVSVSSQSNQTPSMKELGKLTDEEWSNQIRREKFDIILPEVMRKNKVDMWIQVIRPWDKDPMKFEFGCESGIIVFTDRGESRIERAVFEGNIQDPEIFDIVRASNESNSGGNAFEDGEPVERPGGPETKMEFRFKEVTRFVTERDPDRIAVNYSEKLSFVSSLEFEPFGDGISHTDFTLLRDALGEKYGQRLLSAEYLITDYLARRVGVEIEMYHRYGVEAAKNIKQEFDKIIVGETCLSDLEGNVFFHEPDGTEIHGEDPQKHVIEGGELITLLHGAGNDVFHSDLGGLCYVLREGEKDPPDYINKVWEDAMVVREILFQNIKVGVSAGETLNLLIKKIEEAGFVYIDIDRYDKSADPFKTQVHLDCHAIGRSGLTGPRISPFGPEWLRDMIIPLMHTFTFEYMIHMPVPDWGPGKHIYIGFHDGAIVMDKGVEFPYPPVEGIRIIRRDQH